MPLLEQELALLFSKLELPLVVNDIMTEGRTLAPDEEIAFHSAISDMMPDIAMICIATCSMQALKEISSELPEAYSLLIECERIIASYGGIWLARTERDLDPDERFIIETLKLVPKELQLLQEYIEETSLLLSCSEKNYVCVQQLFNILVKQAKAVNVVAKSYLEALGIISDECEERYLSVSTNSVANDNALYY